MSPLIKKITCDITLDTCRCDTNSIYTTIAINNNIMTITIEWDIFNSCFLIMSIFFCRTLKLSSFPSYSSFVLPSCVILVLISCSQTKNTLHSN